MKATFLTINWYTCISPLGPAALPSTLTLTPPTKNLFFLNPTVNDLMLSGLQQMSWQPQAPLIKGSRSWGPESSQHLARNWTHLGENMPEELEKHHLIPLSRGCSGPNGIHIEKTEPEIFLKNISCCLLWRYCLNTVVYHQTPSSFYLTFATNH